MFDLALAYQNSLAVRSNRGGEVGKILYFCISPWRNWPCSPILRSRVRYRKLDVSMTVVLLCY